MAEEYLEKALSMEIKEKIGFSDKTELYKKIGKVLGKLGKYSQAAEKLEMCRGKDSFEIKWNFVI